MSPSSPLGPVSPVSPVSPIGPATALGPTGPASPAPQRFELVVQPPQAGQAWHATLVVPATGVRAEFDSPMALLRHLLRLTLREPTPGGLR